MKWTRVDWWLLLTAWLTYLLALAWTAPRLVPLLR